MSGPIAMFAAGVELLVLLAGLAVARSQRMRLPRATQLVLRAIYLALAAWAVGVFSLALAPITVYPLLTTESSTSVLIIGIVIAMQLFPSVLRAIGLWNLAIAALDQPDRRAIP